MLTTILGVKLDICERPRTIQIIFPTEFKVTIASGTIIEVLDNVELVLIPVHHGRDGQEHTNAHRSLLVINLVQNTIGYLDSFDALRHGRKMLHKRSEYLPAHLHELLSPIKVPSTQQENAFGCGIYMLCNALAVGNGAMPPPSIDCLEQGRFSQNSSL